MGNYDKYKRFIWRTGDASTYEGLFITYLTNSLQGNEKMSNITPHIYLTSFKNTDISFLLNVCPSLNSVQENKKVINMYSTEPFENVLSFIACSFYWNIILNENNVEKRLAFKDYSKDFKLPVMSIEEGKIVNNAIVTKLKELEKKGIFKFEEVNSPIGFDFKAEFEKLCELERIIKSIETSELSPVLVEKVERRVTDNLMPYLRVVLKDCFEDTASYVITPSGVYGDIDRKDVCKYLPQLDYLTELKQMECANAIHSLKCYVNNLWKHYLSDFDFNYNKITKKYTYSEEVKNINGNIGLSVTEADGINFPFDLKEFLNYFTFPFMTWKLINRNAFILVPEDVDNRTYYKLSYDNLIFESNQEDGFYSCLLEGYKNIILLLLKNFIGMFSTRDDNTNGVKEKASLYKNTPIYEYVEALEDVDLGLQEKQNENISVLEGIIDEIISRFKRIVYILSDIEKGNRLSTIEIVSGVGQTKVNQKFQGESFLTIPNTPFSNVKSIAETYSDVGCLHGIYALNKERESKELLFAYKKYDSLFYNNKPLTANFIIGRNEETHKTIKLPLDVPQNIVTAIIAGSGSGKGVLTLTALVNLFVGGYSAIYADFKPDMGATLWDMSRKAGVPIFSIDGKDLKAEGSNDLEIIPYGGENNEYAPNINGVVPSPEDWHGYDSAVYPYVKNVLGDDAVKMIPYLKTMQLFVALGLARKSSKKLLKNMKTLDGGLISDNFKKMFLILDEAQLANTVYDTILSTLNKALKNKNNPEILELSERFNYVFVEKLAKEMKDVVITTGRVSKMGIILIGQQVDPGQWSTSQGSWKECTFGYMIGNAAIKLIGKNGGTSPTYGMPEKFSKNNNTHVGVDLGYWAYTQQVRSGKDASAQGLKTYLILNENDYQINVPYELQEGKFTGGLFKGKEKEDAEQLAVDLTTDLEKQVLRENVGFDGMLKQFLNKGNTEYDTPDASGYSKNYRDKLSFTYYLYEAFLIKAGLVGPNAPYSNLFSYLYSVNPDYFLTAGELYEAFKSNKINKKKDEMGIDVFQFLEPFSAYLKPSLTGLGYNEIKDSEYNKLTISYKQFKEFVENAEKENSKFALYYKEAEDENRKIIEDSDKAFKEAKTQEDKDNCARIKAISERNIARLEEDKAKDLVILKAILEQTTLEKFEAVPMQPEVIKNPIQNAEKTVEKKQIFTVSIGDIENFVNSSLQRNPKIFYLGEKNKKDCLEYKLNQFSNAFSSKKADESKKETAKNLGLVEITNTFIEIEEELKGEISKLNASEEDKNIGLEYLGKRISECKKSFEEKFTKSFDNASTYVVGNNSEKIEQKNAPTPPKEERRDLPMRELGESDNAGGSTEHRGASSQQNSGKTSHSEVKSVNTFKGVTFDHDVDTGDIEINTDNLEKMGNVKELTDITNVLIKDIIKTFGGKRNIKEITVTAAGGLMINGYKYQPKLGASLENSIAQIPYTCEEYKKGNLAIICRMGMVLRNILESAQGLSIEEVSLPNDDIFLKDLGVGARHKIGNLFRKFKSLQYIYLPDEELTRDRPETQVKESLGSRLANLFNFGSGSGENKVPNPHKGSSDYSLSNSILQSKPVKVLGRALGWTIGCKAVVLAATLFGPWGLLFGTLAAVGTYREIKDDRANSSYKSSKRSNNGNSKPRNNNGGRNNSGNNGNNSNNGNGNNNGWGNNNGNNSNNGNGNNNGWGNNGNNGWNN